MPTPVAAARQCLTSEAAATLDAAVAVARRRTHSQTTSLHAVSALLSPSASSTSLLRDACSRARILSSPPARLKLRALDLCLALALDRLPSSPNPAPDPDPNPPVSNSLMAAIKRSQAIQRRTPDAFALPRLPPPSHSAGPDSPPAVLVELRQLILSILDDPVVSRVFSDAGIQSYDVKLAVLRPPAPRLARTRFPPLFLCNFAGPGLDRPSSSSSSSFSDFDDACRRIRDVLLAGRNAFLVGSSAREAVLGFRRHIESADFSPRFSGVRFLAADEGSVAERVREAAGKADGEGVLVDVGDLADFPADGGAAVAELTSLVELRGRVGGSEGSRVWLVGSAANYETYVKFLSAHPTVEKDWNLQLLPITSFQSGIEGRPSSLMQSFVPFGGFFTSISDFKSPLSNIYPPRLRCNQCDKKYEDELSSVLERPKPSSPQQTGLLSWLQREDISKSAIDETKARENEAHMRFVIGNLQKKWNDICLRLHGSNEMLAPDCSFVHHTPVPSVVGFPLIAERTGRLPTHSSSAVTTPSNQTRVENILSTLSDHHDMSLNMSESQNESLSPSATPKLKVTEYRQNQTDGFGTHLRLLPDVSGGDGSPLSASLATDLRLGTNHPPLDKKVDVEYQSFKEQLKDSSQCLSSVVDSESIAANTYLVGSCQKDKVSPASVKSFDACEIKSLLRELIEMVGRQEAAIHVISKTIAHCKSGNQRRCTTSLRGDIWFNFAGHDRVGKMKVAKALAALMFGSSKNIICVDLNSQHCEIPSNTIVNIGADVCGYDSHIRGQTAVDYIASELRKKPLSVVFLDNVHQADMLLQNSLICALKTGMFPDSHGRQAGIKNTIFVTTTKVTNYSFKFSETNSAIFREDVVSSAIECPLQMLIGHSVQLPFSSSSNVIVTSQDGILMGSDATFASQLTTRKRKIEDLEHGRNKLKLSLDLNLSIEEMEQIDEDDEDEDKDCLSESSEVWLEEFYDLVDAIVDFEPFDFHTSAQNVLKKIAKNLESSMGSEALLEIDVRCMEQLLAAAWICEKINGIEDWINNVLSKSFIEAKERCKKLFVTAMKLVCSEQSYQVEQLPQIRLPARISLR